MTPVRVTLERTAEADAALPLPAYATAGAAGADLRADLPSAERAAGRALPPGARTLVPTGVRIALPAGVEAQIRPRSGLALTHGVTLANAPGTIDSDYRGPLGVILINLGAEVFTVAHGARIAQMVIAPVLGAEFALGALAGATGRGEGGFGSTGDGR